MSEDIEAVIKAFSKLQTSKTAPLFHINSTNQNADILTKGPFTVHQWTPLVRRFDFHAPVQGGSVHFSGILNFDTHVEQTRAPFFVLLAVERNPTTQKKKN